MGDQLQWRRRAAAAPRGNAAAAGGNVVAIGDVLVYEGGDFISLRQEEVRSSTSVPPPYVIQQLNYIRQRIDPDIFNQLYVVGVQYNADSFDIQVGTTESMSRINNRNYMKTRYRGKKEELQMNNKHGYLNYFVQQPLPPRFGRTHNPWWGTKEGRINPTPSSQWYITYVLNDNRYVHNNTYAHFTKEQKTHISGNNRKKRKACVIMIGTQDTLRKIFAEFNRTAQNAIDDSIMRPVLIKLSHFLDNLGFWNCELPQREVPPTPMNNLGKIVAQITSVPLIPEEGAARAAGRAEQNVDLRRQEQERNARAQMQVAAKEARAAALAAAAPVVFGRFGPPGGRGFERREVAQLAPGGERGFGALPARAVQIQRPLEGANLLPNFNNTINNLIELSNRIIPREYVSNKRVTRKLANISREIEARRTSSHSEEDIKIKRLIDQLNAVGLTASNKKDLIISIFNLENQRLVRGSGKKIKSTKTVKSKSVKSKSVKSKSVKSKSVKSKSVKSKSTKSKSIKK